MPCKTISCYTQKSIVVQAQSREPAVFSFIYVGRSERKICLDFSGNIHTDVRGSNLIGLFKIKHMTSCIPICVLLVYDGILQYSFGFGLYTPLTSAKSPKGQLAVEYLSHWLQTAGVAAFPVVEITDCAHS